MSIQVAATIVALGIAFVLMAAVPAVLIWVFLATLRGDGIIEDPAQEDRPVDGEPVGAAEPPSR